MGEILSLILDELVNFIILPILSNFFPFLYGLSVFLLLFVAVRVMFNGFFLDQSRKKTKAFSTQSNGDRTGRITIHPELLNTEGRITDEDLLTVRFSKDNDPPQSLEKPSE